jgi:hypothetical protein
MAAVESGAGRAVLILLLKMVLQMVTATAPPGKLIE